VYSFVVVSTHGRGGRSARGGRGGTRHPQHMYCKRMGHVQEKSFSFHNFPGKTDNISKAVVIELKFSNEEYQEYLRLKSNNLAQHLQIPTCQHLASQAVESQSP